MEKHPSMKQPQPHDLETLILDLTSPSPTRRLPLPDLLLLLESPPPLPPHLLPHLLTLLRSILLDDHPLPLKDHSMVSVTTLYITAADPPSPPHLSALTETLLTVANHPNHGPDRHSRAVACQCLRELELAYPLLLSEVTGHIWTLAHAERTHSSQAYLLLLATVFSNIVRYGTVSASSILATPAPLTPFTAPVLTGDTTPLTETSIREIRRVVAFLLERPQSLTPPAVLQLVSIITGMAGELERHVPAVAALLKVRFSGLIYSYDPLLCHAVLMLYSRFADAFLGGDEGGIARRLARMPGEVHYPVVFRLLALHWLMGLARLEDSLPGLTPWFYPGVFDPLALKAKKLDALACVAANADAGGGGGAMGVKLFEDGLVCVSAFKWLPPWSTETSVALRTLHRFLIGVAYHQDDGLKDPGIGKAVVESTIFPTIQNMLVKLALDHRGLVSVVAVFIDRLLECKVHRPAGDRLLQTLDEHLLPKLQSNYQLASYFPIFERIAKNETIPPRGLLELLSKYMVSLVEKYGPDTELRSWSQGTKVLGICRTMLKHHHSSRVFVPMSRLLSFTCQCFPDLEVRDNARIYLRMLICIPGKKMRHVLSLGEQLPGISPAPHTGSFLQAPSPRPARDLKKSLGVSSYIHLERVIPLLVKQSWSLTIPNLVVNDESSRFVGIGDISVIPSTELEKEEQTEVSFEMIGSPREQLRVTDSKVAEILRILRRHFECIPDYRHMPGIKISIPCILRFESAPFNRVWGVDSSSPGSDELGLPALYATTITFSSTSKYGSISPCRVPFLIGEPLEPVLDIVLAENNFEQASSSRAPVTIELEPREPRPGLIDVAIKANAENGQIISGSLESVTVGIEDMFLKAAVPADITEDQFAEYYLDLFHALWEACGSSVNTGRETFSLSGGKGVAAISGTRSVKLLEVYSHSLIRSVERYLAPFVVSVTGQSLVKAVKVNGVISDVIWEVNSEDHCAQNIDALVPYTENLSLQLPYVQDVSNEVNSIDISKRTMGIFHILIFLPPRFHLLFQMEVGEVSTLVRIRTDHWPCLAYVDEYLESFSLV